MTKPSKIYILLLLLFPIVSCKSQTNTYKEGSGVEREILTVFFNNIKQYSYIDKNIQGKNLINQFIGNYKHNIRFYKNADSICKNSGEMDKLKFYCPIADSFSKFNSILSEEDVSFLREKYASTKTQLRIIDLDAILPNTIPLLKHSKEYYKSIDYDDYKSQSKNNEFPTIRILNIFYNKDISVAVIAYNPIDGPITHVKPSYFILKKVRNIWWKPIGNLKL